MNADEFLDITDVVCPMTFVKTKVALEDFGRRTNFGTAIK